ncbi:DUF2339 domain-containing protein [Sinorhizobium sp. BG8]|uniref:DUF2339 domain-containing protein n=1 Tax=Sinorhizobium sp. BG8 TaxID=2613773 RepID=UPI00193E1B8B|nr:DUF2339 domain-containing protein [Sinorhizobium sp. BG8]QRM54830.1 DUF2339 domain-containing protein [Sinorhizobium sp. BG8]
MAEILALVGVILAIAAMNAARKNSARLEQDILALRQEVEALKRGEPLPAADMSEAESVGNIAEAAETAGEPTEEFASPWARARENREKVDAAGLAVSAKAGADAAGASTSLSEAGDVPEGARVAGQAGESLESRIGARWAVWVGGLALALGGVFMVKYSIESGLLSPAVRLSLAAAFGLLLLAGGEVIRRRAQPLLPNEFRNAMIPGILTAAGAVTLFGATYVAHGFYGYFGSFTAFLLLSLVAFATIGLSLLHGQALAGLGLLGSMTVPLLVATERPSVWGLFGFLTLTWLATLVASRLRRWTVVPSLGNLGLGLWSVLYLSQAVPVESTPVVLSLAVMLAGLGLLWPAGADAAESAPETAHASGDASPDAPVAAEAPWRRFLAPQGIALPLSGSLAVLLPALVLAAMAPALPRGGLSFALLIAALAVLGCLRGWAALPAILASVGALLGTVILAVLPGGVPIDTLLGEGALPDTAGVASAVGRLPVGEVLGLSATLGLAGAAALTLFRRRLPPFAALWSILMTATPLALAAISFLAFGNLSFDLGHGLFALAFGAVLLAGAEMLGRGWDESDTRYLPLWALVSGGFAFLCLGVHALTDGLATTLLVSALGMAAVVVTRLRRWPVLPWIMVAAAVVVAGRIAWEPTIVGAAALSKTPVFNQLLAGYGVPALLLVLAAYMLRAWPGERVRNLLQALASLFALLTAAILVRHAMNGGVLDSAFPTLGEQSVYTLLAAGASAVLMTLDIRSPSPTFRFGSMVIGAVSMLSILLAHFIGLNPYFTGEPTGSIPFFNLLLVGYLLPGVAFAGLAFYARDKRPAPYVMMLALTGAALVFAWVTLSVRRYWHGEGIADWKGFLQGETYTYSVVWLLLGVLLLIAGSRFDAKSIRLSSAALVLIAVVKVFLIDMSNLEGILRALSFIGLGAVLIGIGLFYQKVLSGKGRAGQVSPPAELRTGDGT